MGSEIVTIHVGQAGVQISHALWELVCVEHGVGADGLQIWNPSQFDEEEFGRNFVFREVQHDKFVPRALLVDLEPTVVDEIRTGAYRELWHPQQLITGKEDAASNFARGYYSQSRFELNEVTDRIRILVEQCEHLACFKLLYSANGGTGSGLTSALCERLSDEYGKKYKFATTVYPSPGYSELMVEPYNSLLHSSTNLTFCDCVVLTDNEAMLNVVEETLKLSHAGFVIPNRVIANAVTTQFLSHRYRFVGQQHAYVNELLINLIPYPRIHFPMMAYAPFFVPASEHFEKCTAPDLVRSVFDDTNQLLSVSAIRRAYISCALLFRGPISPVEAINAITTIKGDRMNRARFVDWCPTGFKVGVNAAPPLQGSLHNTLPAKQLSLTMIAGNLAIRDVWTGIGRRFDQLYQKRAYVHWYVAEGMEEGEFTLAREVIQQLVDDYEAIAKDAEGAVVDSSTNYIDEPGMKPIIRTTPRVNRSPLNPTEPNMNQATTLDDPNSLRTLENNEDAISLDTNQHHSNSIHSDAYQYSRLRLPDSTDWRIPSSQVTKKMDTIPENQPIRKRRLRFPENPLEMEENQNNALGLSVLARSGMVYGTNCSAAVAQRRSSRQIGSCGSHRSQRESRILKHMPTSCSESRPSFCSTSATLNEERQNPYHSLRQNSTDWVGEHQLGRFSTTDNVSVTDQRALKQSEQHDQVDFKHHTSSPILATPYGSKEITRLPVTPPVNLTPDHCPLSCRTPSIQTNPNNCSFRPSEKHIRSCESDLSPPQVTPIRSPQTTLQRSDVQSTNFSHVLDSRPVNNICCTKFQHRTGHKEKVSDHTCQQQRGHHHYYRHHHHHHHHHHPPHHHHRQQERQQQRHNERQTSDQKGHTSRIDVPNQQPCQVIFETGNDLICTSNDVSEIPARSLLDTTDQSYQTIRTGFQPSPKCDQQGSLYSQDTVISATVTPKEYISSARNVGPGFQCKCSECHNFISHSALSDMDYMQQYDLPRPPSVELHVQEFPSDSPATISSHEFAINSTDSHHQSDTLDQCDTGFDVPPEQYASSVAPSLDQP